MLNAPALGFEFRRASPPPINRAPSDLVAIVRAVLELPDSELDYASAKLAFDRVVDPSVDVEGVLAELTRLAESARKLGGPAPSNRTKLEALRTLIYKSGPWNDWRPFDYDHSNIRGENVRLKLLSHYLESRKGDCVSMPILFLILADKLELNMALSLAPNHFFLQHRLADGRIINLEPTSGALPQRDEWLRHVRPMSDRSIESGMYLRPLSKREGVASMAGSVVQHLRDEGCFEEAAAVCELILARNPRDGLVLVNLASVCRKLGLRLIEKYRDELLIPLNLRPRYWMHVARYHTALAEARALGWE